MEQKVEHSRPSYSEGYNRRLCHDANSSHARRSWPASCGPRVLWCDGARVVDREPRLDPLLADAEQPVRAHPPDESASVRTMYKRVGIDPTKTRPSNEALLRRVRKGSRCRA